jgi:hypothetical protein
MRCGFGLRHDRGAGQRERLLPSRPRAPPPIPTSLHCKASVVGRHNREAIVIADPYKPPSSSLIDPGSDMTIEVSWGRATKVWWSLLWRALLFGVVAGGAVGFVIGFILGAVGTPAQVITTVTTWAGVLIGIPVGIWVVRTVLRKSWSDFRIALVPVRRG